MSPSVILCCLRACNLTCAHCYCDGSPDNDVRLSLADVSRALLDLNRLGIWAPPYVDLTGGEFVLHPDASEIAALIACRFPSACLILETNGVALCAGRASAYDAIPFKRLHLSISHLHGNIGRDGKSAALAEAIHYRRRRGFELVINYIPRPGEAELPECIRAAQRQGIRVNRFTYETLAPLGRGARLEQRGPGVTVTRDRADFFRCELGEGVLLDADGCWYVCHFPRPGTLVGRIGDAALESRFQRMLSSESARSLRSKGLLDVYLACVSKVPDLRDRLFHNRCEPCLLLQELGLLEFCGPSETKNQ